MNNNNSIQQHYDRLKAKGLNLDMSRGKPHADIVSLSNGMLTLPGADFKTEGGLDCRNYGVLDGIPEAKRLFALMLGVAEPELIVGGNSSLQMMYDSVARAMIFGVDGDSPGWLEQSRKSPVKFLCPVPGYDRHFSICERFGIEMLNIPTDENGPDMDMIEKLVAEDESVKGIWCVPIYANPTGVTYSDSVVRRFASMKTKASDFRIFWDCAYVIHHLTDTPDTLLNILDECKKHGNGDRVYMFASTSKVTFPGGGVAVMAASETNTSYIKKHMSFQTIGGDKLNQLRHVRFFGDFDGMTAHMEKIRKILKPRFDIVCDMLEEHLSPCAEWHTPRGGYFVSFNGKPGTAKRIVRLCKEAGLTLTDAGATFPYMNDPEDRNIRIAPSFLSLEELNAAMEVFCVSALTVS